MFDGRYGPKLRQAAEMLSMGEQKKAIATKLDIPLSLFDSDAFNHALDRVSKEVEMAKEPTRPIASIREIKEFWTNAMRDEGEEMKERLAASKLLAQTKPGLFKGPKVEHQHRFLASKTDEELLEIINSYRVVATLEHKP